MALEALKFLHRFFSEVDFLAFAYGFVLHHFFQVKLSPPQSDHRRNVSRLSLSAWYIDVGVLRLNSCAGRLRRSRALNDDTRDTARSALTDSYSRDI